MKFKFVAIAVLGLGLAVSSCGSKGSDKPMSDYQNMSETDSLAFYLGEMYADQFRNMKEKDSTMTKEDFINGLEAGASIVKDSEAYNRGLMMGLQMALQSREFKKEIGETINENMVFNGVAYGLSSDTIPNISEAHKNFQMISSRIGKRAQEKLEAEMNKKVAEQAKKEGYKKNGELYEKVNTPGQGENLKQGQEFKYEMSVIAPDGKPVEQLSQPGEQTAILGRTVPLQTALGRALLTMKPGESASFLFGADQFLNGNAKALGLESADVLTLKLKIGTEVKMAADDTKSSPVNVAPARSKK